MAYESRLVIHDGWTFRRVLASRRCVRVAFAVSLLLGPAITWAQLVNVFNPSFERPVVPPNTGILVTPSDVDQGALPTDSYWGFKPGTGVVAKGYVFSPGSPLGNFQVPTPPDGNQWAFLDPEGGIIWQTLMFPLSGQYTLTFTSGLSPFFAVAIDNPSKSVTLTRQAQNANATVSMAYSFEVNAGPHVLVFVNTDDRADAGPHPPSLIDAVSVGPQPGDANLDGRVDFNDLLIVAQHYGLTSGQTYETGDLNGDGGVAFDDLLIVSQNYGSGEGAAGAATMPEPSSLVVMVLACLTTLRRRRVSA